jgi:phage head maturation protease
MACKSFLGRAELAKTGLGPQGFSFSQKRRRSFDLARKSDRPFGIDFTEHELLEFSVVTVPANAEALIDGKSYAQDRARQRRERELEVIRLRAGC